MGAAVIVRTSARKVGADDAREAVQSDRDDHRRCEADDDEHRARQDRGRRCRGSRIRAHGSSVQATRPMPTVDHPASVAERVPATLTREG